MGKNKDTTIIQLYAPIPVSNEENIIKLNFFTKKWTLPKTLITRSHCRGAPSGSVGRASDSRSRGPVFETRTVHLVVGSDLT